MVAYAVVETALARMHGADPTAQRGAFRGRLKHFQRLGLPLGEKPGKGKRIDYDQEQIVQLAVALELSEVGVDPTVTVALISGYWDIFRIGIVDEPSITERKGNILKISMGLMSASWRPAGYSLQGIYSIGWCPRPSCIDEIFSDKSGRVVLIDFRRMLSDLYVNIREVSEGV